MKSAMNMTWGGLLGLAPSDRNFPINLRWAKWFSSWGRVRTEGGMISQCKMEMKDQQLLIISRRQQQSMKPDVGPCGTSQVAHSRRPSGGRRDKEGEMEKEEEGREK